MGQGLISYSNCELHGDDTLVIYILVVNKCIIQTYLGVVTFDIVVESGAQESSIALLFDRRGYLFYIQPNRMRVLLTRQANRPANPIRAIVRTGLKAP